MAGSVTKTDIGEEKKTIKLDTVARKKSSLIFAVVIFAGYMLMVFQALFSPARADKISSIVVVPPSLAEANNLEDGLTRADFVAAMQLAADAGQQVIRLRPEVRLDTGGGRALVEIENPVYNTYPITAALRLAGGREIVEPGMIYPGQRIYGIPPVALSGAGEEVGVIVLRAYDADTGRLAGMAEVEAALIASGGGKSAGWLEVSLPTSVELGSREGDGGAVYSPVYSVVNRSDRAIEVTAVGFFVAPDTDENILFRGMELRLVAANRKRAAVPLRDSENNFLGDGLEHGATLRLEAAVGEPPRLEFGLSGRAAPSRAFSIELQKPQSAQYILVFRVKAV